MLARPSINRIVDVRSYALAALAQAQVSNRGMLIVDTDVIPYDTGVIEITNLNDMIEIYKISDKSPVYKQAKAYFSGIAGFLNVPGSLLLAKDIRNYSVPATLYGNKGVDIDDVNAAGAGTLNVIIDTSTIPVAITNTQITGGLTAIAAFIQTTIKGFASEEIKNQIDLLKSSLKNEEDKEKKQKLSQKLNELQANLYPNATCVFDAGLNRFIIASGENGAGKTIGYCTGAAIATALKLTANSGARTEQGKTGATIYEQMDYILRREVNFAMFGYVNPLTLDPTAEDTVNKQIIDQLNWSKDPLNARYVNQYQFAFTISNISEFDPLSTTNAAAWLRQKGYARKNEIALADGSPFIYTTFNTNVTLIWDRDNTNRMLGGMMSYGASWIVNNVNTFPSWNNALAGLVSNDITDSEYQVLVNNGYNVYTSFAPALVDTTKNEMGNCGIIGVGLTFSDVMYLSQFYVMRTLNNNLQIALSNVMNSANSIAMNGDGSSLPNIPKTSTYFDSVLNPIFEFYVNGIYLTAKKFNLAEESDMQQLREIKQYMNVGTTDDDIIAQMANPCYMIQYNEVTNATKISGKEFAKAVYCVGSQVRSLSLLNIATN